MRCVASHYIGMVAISMCVWRWWGTRTNSPWVHWPFFPGGDLHSRRGYHLSTWNRGTTRASCQITWILFDGRKPDGSKTLTCTSYPLSFPIWLVIFLFCSCLFPFHSGRPDFSWFFIFFLTLFSFSKRGYALFLFFESGSSIHPDPVRCALWRCMYAHYFFFAGEAVPRGKGLSKDRGWGSCRPSFALSLSSCFFERSVLSVPVATEWTFFWFITFICLSFSEDLVGEVWGRYAP